MGQFGATKTSQRAGISRVAVIKNNMVIGALLMGLYLEARKNLHSKKR